MKSFFFLKKKPVINNKKTQQINNITKTNTPINYAIFVLLSIETNKKASRTI